jgi:hypothetical protein
MADILTFDPQKDYVILEEITDFEEEVQRSEQLRFFTLEEQLLDYQSKVLYSKTKVTRFDQKNLKKEIERFQKVYEDNIVFSPEKDDYVVDNQRKTINIPWVQDIYAKFTYETYKFPEKWDPLMDPLQRTTPNFYDNMIRALPLPYTSTEQEGVPIDENVTLVDEKGEKSIVGLKNYHKTVTARYDDGSFSILKTPILDTTDNIRRKGYYIGIRPVDIPKPIQENTFLSSIRPTEYITNKPLIEIFPEIETILNNAVPTTTDPYGEGLKFLKVYDVKLSQIPWSSWKERFPPVDLIRSSPEVLTINFPESRDQLTISESVQKEYMSTAPLGINERYWLSMQEDAGKFISKIFLRNVGAAGNLAPQPSLEDLKMMFPESTPEECLVTKSFDDFLSSSIYRSPVWKDVSKAIDDNKTIPLGKCIPPEVILQETKRLLTAGTAWSENTPEDIIKSYRTLLRKFVTLKEEEKVEVYETYKSKPDSELKKDVLNILKDNHRDPDDKADAILLLVKELQPKNNQFLDNDEQLVVCNHTIRLLRGDLEVDQEKFFNEWTEVQDGSHVCKFCSEVINNKIFVAKDDWDDSGNVIISYDKLETNEPKTTSNIISSDMNNIQNLFDKKSAAEIVLLLSISLLQINPEESVIKPIIDFIRGLVSFLRSNTKIPAQKREEAEGIIGVVGCVVLLQTHVPFLYPKSSFGIKIFKTTGFPRDRQADPKDSPVINNLIYVLTSYFKNFPTTFDKITAFTRLLAKSKNIVKAETIKQLDGAYKYFQTQFQIAERMYTEPDTELLSQNIDISIIQPDKTEYKPFERVGTEELLATCIIPHPYIINVTKMPPSLVQQTLKLLDIKPTTQTLITPQPTQVPIVDIDNETEIGNRLAKGVPKKLLKNDKLKDFLNSKTTDLVSVTNMFSRVMDLLSTREDIDLKMIQAYREQIVYLKTVNVDKKLLRDITRGLFYEFLDNIPKKEGKVIDEALDKDLTMIMLLFTKEQAEKISNAASTKERDYFKNFMRKQNDLQREAYKRLIDIGMTPQVIGIAQLIQFAEEYNSPPPQATDQDISEDGENLIDRSPDYDTNYFENIDHGEVNDMFDNGDYSAEYDNNTNEGE